MILTCPECDTKYVVKDGAIPPGGRQVRCAACKHSWHEDAPAVSADDDVMTADFPAKEAVEAPPVEQAFGGPPPPDPGEVIESPLAEETAMAADEQMVSDYPEPEPSTSPDEPAGYAPREPDELDAAYEESAHSDDFLIPRFHDEPATGGGLKIALLALLVIAIAVAAFWFLAPASLKSRVGLSPAGATPLEVMLTNSDRQKLASGNELLAISGRIINPTDTEQAVPPIRASLRNKATRQLVYQWTIAPPARTLPPRGSMPFNSAEVDIPEGGDELTVSLGALAG